VTVPTVQSLGFTPLKGGRQSEPESLHYALSGPVGDHTLAVVDLERGRVLKTVENPALLHSQARWDGDALTIEIHGAPVTAVPTATGERRSLDYWGRATSVEILEGPWAEAFAAALGRDVALARAERPGGFVFGDPVTIVTTGALARFGDVDPRRFRANLVVDTGADDLESEWMSRQLDIGEARLDVTGAVTRCAVIDFDHGDGTTAKLLKALAASDSRDLTFGLYARVTRPGRVSRGDTVRLATS
jgi:uncharacterized protein